MRTSPHAATPAARARVRSLLSVLAGFGAVALLGPFGCGDDTGSSAIESGGCSSCQEAYTAEQCSAWGGLAGCTGATTTTEQTCDPSFAGCSFDSCEHRPICADDGAATCFDCDNPNLTDADCDKLAKAANCDSFTLIMGTACDQAATGCDFLGCDFDPCPT